MLEREARSIHDEDIAANRALGAHGAALIEDGSTVLTHCNAGALATAGYGTALGVIRAAVEADKRISVYCSETRPFLQGARLTAWELKKEHIPVTLITDNMVGHLMKEGLIDCVVVGTDRTAANGDVANKIGTYTVAVLAHRHGIPFYVAAPISSIDLNCPRGDKIPIEERSSREVTHIFDRQIAPARHQGRQPGLRRDAARARDRDHHRARHRAAAVQQEPAADREGRGRGKGEAPPRPRTTAKRQSKKG